MITVKKYLEMIEDIGNVYLEYPDNPEFLNGWIERRNKIFTI
jgi:hypothetical protein